MTNEVKGQLAKLLATENLIVEHRVCQTAMFDVDKRVLTLPIWDTTERVYNMLVGHEVGHALFTPTDDWKEMTIHPDLPQSYVNVTEDARIEKLMKRKFPGLSKDFFEGYRQLNDQDFFQIEEEIPEDIHLIDRINLHFKIGAYSVMPFNDAERVLRDAVEVAETFQQAVDAAAAIYEYEKKKQEQEKIESLSEDGGTDDISLDQKSGDSIGASPDDSGEEGKAQNKKGDHEEGKKEEKPDNQAEAQPEGGRSCDELEAKTDAALKESLEDLVDKSESHPPVYITVPNVDLEHHIVDASKVHELNNEYWGNDYYTNPDHEYFRPLDWTYTDNEYRQFKKDCSREVNYLSKEFEMKKAATSYARQSVSRTGVLDTKKLYSYRYNEDIFKRITSTPDGKNHGLIFLLDWSGSMADELLDTYKQLLSLCLFCRKSGIPFDVYAFVQDGHYWSQNCSVADMDKGNKDEMYIPPSFFLVNYLNSRLNNATFDTYARDLWRICYMIDTKYTYRYSSRKQIDFERTSSVPDAVPSHMQLGGTPLNEAIACLQSLIPDFQKKNGVEKVHVSILTDGDGAHPGYWREPSEHRKQINEEYGYKTEECYRSAMPWSTQLRDRNNGRVYSMSMRGHSDYTKLLLRYLKGRFPECNFLGFRIAQAREIRRYFEYETKDSEKYMKTFSKTKCVSAPILGYQEIFFINPTSLNTDDSFEPKSDSKADIKRAFTKSLKSKKNNKKILSSFIDQIA